MNRRKFIRTSGGLACMAVAPVVIHPFLTANATEDRPRVTAGKDDDKPTEIGSHEH